MWKRNKFIGKKRNRYTITYDILRSVLRGRRQRTKIMYDSNLSWVPLSELLKRLVDCGLLKVKLKKVDDYIRPLYFITEKGVEFVKMYEKLAKMLIKNWNKKVARRRSNRNRNRRRFLFED